MIKIKSIQTSKTARYVLSNNPSNKIKNVWIICHGYGQTSIGFLKWFNPIFSEDTIVIAPEGLSKFYWEGFNGKVVSSWMTKEDRENEINDYVNFIENVIAEIKPKLNNNVKYHALGFSQGTATISRWANFTNLKLKSITLWSGLFPDDIINSWSEKKSPKLYFFFGDNDPFINSSKIKQQELNLNKEGIVYEINFFIGKHKVEKKPLLVLNNKVQ